MTYTTYSFVALSRLPHAKSHLSQKEKPAAPRTDALKLAGSARISQIGVMEPWYVRLIQRMLDHVAALVGKDRLEFELTFNLNPKQSEGSNAALLELTSQLGFMPGKKGTVVLAEVSVISKEELASTID